MTGKPILLSTGLCSLEDVRRSADFIRGIWARQAVNQDLAVLHCVTSYPTPFEEANLRAITDLARLGYVTGYSDHTLGIEAAVAAVALGARVIEKHFTLAHDYSDFHDHKISADPSELTELVRRIQRMEKMLGDGVKKVERCEQQVLSRVRRSIVADQELVKGSVLALKDLSWTRPFCGLAPGEEGQVLGKRLKRNLAAGEAILPDDLE
jgi:sialic acid synthase SpsE